MPTIFTHIAVPLAAALALGPKRVPPSMLLMGMLVSVLPDFDGITYQFGVRLHGMLGHRGVTHTLLFALLCGAVGWCLAVRWKVSRLAGFAWGALCCLSHPLLDMFTSGGSGIALLWPWSDQRLFSPWRPIKVSPIAASQFFSYRGMQVLRSEFFTVWLPLLALSLPFAVLRTIRKSP